MQRKGIHEVMSKDMALLHKAVKLVPPISIKGIVDLTWCLMRCGLWHRRR